MLQRMLELITTQVRTASAFRAWLSGGDNMYNVNDFLSGYLVENAHKCKNFSLKVPADISFQHSNSWQNNLRPCWVCTLVQMMT